MVCYIVYDSVDIVPLSDTAFLATHGTKKSAMFFVEFPWRVSQFYHSASTLLFTWVRFNNITAGFLISFHKAGTFLIIGGNH